MMKGAGQSEEGQMSGVSCHGLGEPRAAWVARGRHDTQKRMTLWEAEKVQSVLESGRAVLGVQGRMSC